MSKDWTTLWGQARHQDPREVESALRREGARPPSPRAEQGIPGAGRRGSGQRSGSSIAPGRTVLGAPRRQGGLGGRGALRAAAPGPRGGGWRASRRLPAAAAELFAASTSWEPRPGRSPGRLGSGRPGGAFLDQEGEPGSSEIATCRVAGAFAGAARGSPEPQPPPRLVRAPEWGSAGGWPTQLENERTFRCNAPGRPFQTVPPTRPPRSPTFITHLYQHILSSSRSALSYVFTCSLLASSRNVRAPTKSCGRCLSVPLIACLQAQGGVPSSFVREWRDPEREGACWTINEPDFSPSHSEEVLSSTFREKLDWFRG